ncbi:AraC family transcriptional regulator [uncultured Polaribacter sp.]|uniref:helix-turn-helix domain-containing protein n=1 Tax=uncultured Polaribacter sp. TaxID=174711 RepID=UPI0026376F03|nr:helix-turn-helix domain-containing protein [uncultured Polaribacter sp.]
MNSHNFNVYNIIIIIGIVHGIIFSLLLFFNAKLKSRTNNYLALTILSLCFSNLQYWLLDVGLSPKYENHKIIFIPFEFLMLPMFLLFVKNYLDNKLKKSHVHILFLPFFITTLYLILNDFIKIDAITFKFFNLIIEYSSITFSLVIIILIFKTILDYEKKIKKDSFDKIPKTVSWLKRILIIGFSLCILWALSLTLFGPYFPSGYSKYYPLWIGISVLIYWIAYTSIFQNSIYEDRGEIRGKNTYTRKNIRTQIKQLEIDKPTGKINTNKFIEINNLILKNKLFLNPKLSLKIISRYTNFSEGYLSQIINTNTHKNFNEYINHLRVENAKKLLLDEDYSKYTITAIGLESGFHTKTSFYSAFKKNTGQTPNAYKKLVQNL